MPLPAGLLFFLFWWTGFNLQKASAEEKKVNSGNLGASEAAPYLRIDFHAHSEVDDGEILLGDIADITAFSVIGTTPEIYKAIKVGPAGKFGTTRSLDTKKICVQINDHVELASPQKISLYCEETILKVKTRADVLSADSLKILTREFLISGENGFSVGGSESFAIEFVSIPDSINVPTSPHELKVGFTGRKTKGLTTMQLLIFDKAQVPQKAPPRVLRKVPFRVKLDVFEEVCVATRKISRGEAISEDNMALLRHATTQLQEPALSDCEALVSATARQVIPKGRIMVPRLLSMPAAVKKGQRAEVVWNHGNIRIRADVICRQDGAVGEIISIRNLASQRLQRGRVTKEGRLEPVDSWSGGRKGI